MMFSSPLFLPPSPSFAEQPFHLTTNGYESVLLNVVFNFPCRDFARLMCLKMSAYKHSVCLEITRPVEVEHFVFQDLSKAACVCVCLL